MKTAPFRYPTFLAASLLFTIPSCTQDSTGEATAADKAELADAQSGKADGVDICAAWDWYDDDFCDDPYEWCQLPDPDCGPDGDSCPSGWTWSGEANEGCVETPAAPAEFSEAQVIGHRYSTASELRAWANVAVDDTNTVHAVYVGSGIKPTYATPTDGWVPHVLDTNYVRAGLTVAADTQVHVAFIDSSYRLHYLLVDDASVVDQEVTSAGSYVYSVGMALGSESTHLVYGSGDLSQRLSSRSGELGDMQGQGIVELTNVKEAPEAPAVVVDDQGGVHVMYGTQPAAYNLSSSASLRYAYRDPAGVWSDEFVVRATRDGGGLGLGPDGAPYSAYRGHVNGAQTLMFAERRNGTDGPWETAPLLGAGVFGSAPGLAVSSDGTLHVVYRTTERTIAHVARPPGETWTAPEQLDEDVSMVSSDRISIAIGGDDSIHVLYNDINSLEVRYVTRP